MLSNLSNEELELRLKEFVHKEKLLLHIILDHIKEVDNRKLYLERAYSSLYEYLVKELGYSGSAAMRRQEAARLLKEIPALGQKIRLGSINLSQLAELSKAIKQKEKLNYQNTQDKKLSQISTSKKEELLLSIENKTVPETQKIIAKILNLPLLQGDVTRMQKDGSVRLEITFTQDQYNLLLQCKDLAAHCLKQKNQDLSWGSVISHTSEQYVRKNAPRIKNIPVQKITLAKTIDSAEHYSTQNNHTHSQVVTNSHYKSGTGGQRFQLTKTADHRKPAPYISAHSSTMGKSRTTCNLSSKQRHEILARDSCCQFKDPKSGKICGSRFGLEVDHKVPKWTQKFTFADNLNEPTNLQALCSNHNKYKYRKECHSH